ncbi:hypothetical protein L484_023045 [Morus notabilis]|uniref:Uncharacterized protein n=1 Tax=Morus notabilis TaxID=981085 RepID=W9S9H7_9ROSA|nr:uncharacterized protein LOC21405825 [Morus notabilis]EXB94936.1 hypothetical protein L484_023045 [Morus notabilis]
MGSYNMILLAGLLETLREASKIFLRKGKLIPLITILSLFLSSIIFLSNFLSLKPLVFDFALKLTVLLVTNPAPGSSAFTNAIFALKEGLSTIVGVDWAFIIANSLTSLFFATAVIIASAAKYNGKETLHVKDLLFTVGQTWKRPFITLFYTALLDLGYALYAFAFVLPLVLISDREFSFFLFFTIVSIIISIFYLHLSVVWTLAIVVSVLEEKSGIEALGKAAQLLKGLKLRGFCLKLLFGTLYYVLLKLTILRMINKIYSTSISIVTALVFLNTAGLIKMYSLTAYTVFYYQCKKTHGEEEITHEMQGSNGYSLKASHTPLIPADIP